ncbi:hypothetical protein [Saccharothrix luteola]|uniref:hypothetical protein n=1 Tax=Saccharothrix luteola TaxID=2893018 RepID=UPI001E3FCBF9|nr:hypothetical protein [Saccharothrix luteola]MCC8249384.1 hypothetical protein [Saccharothrix luteola]
MTALTFGHADTLIIVEGQVLEVFQRGGEGSLRVPLAWLGVWLETDKPGRTRIVVGARTTPGGPVYSAQPLELYPFRRLPVDAEDVARYRAFFVEVAALAGRPSG